jgi:hypothetical protein
LDSPGDRLPLKTEIANITRGSVHGHTSKNSMD